MLTKTDLSSLSPKIYGEVKKKIDTAFFVCEYRGREGAPEVPIGA